MSSVDRLDLNTFEFSFKKMCPLFVGRFQVQGSIVAQYQNGIKSLDFEYRYEILRKCVFVC